MLHPNIDTHFVFGTIFDNLNTSSKTAFYSWFYQEIKGSKIRSLQCTFYFGRRLALISKEMSVDTYNGKVTIGVLFDDFAVNLAKPESSVNDDLEEFIRYIQHGHTLSSDETILFLDKMLTRNELQKIKNNDEDFWKTLFNSSSKIEDCKRDFTIEYPDHDKKHKFITCHCIRYSFRIK